MTVTLHRVTSFENCGICLDSMANSEVVAHAGIDGTKHPWHLECIKPWINMSDHCPVCKRLIDVNSLFSWTEWYKNELNHMKVDAETVMKLASETIVVTAICLSHLVVSTFVFEGVSEGVSKLVECTGGVAVGSTLLVVIKLVDGILNRRGLLYFSEAHR